MLTCNRTGFLFALSLKSPSRLSRSQFMDLHSGVSHPSVSSASPWTSVTRPAMNCGSSNCVNNRPPRRTILSFLTWRPTRTLPTTNSTALQSTLPRQMPKRDEPPSCFSHLLAGTTLLFLTRRSMYRLLAQRMIGFPPHHGR